MRHAQRVQHLVALGFAEGLGFGDGRRHRRQALAGSAARKHRGDAVRAGFGAAEAGHASGRQARQRLGGIGHQHGGQRPLMAGTVDDGLHRQLRLRARRTADDGQHQVELRRFEQDVEHALHHVVARTGHRQVEHAAGCGRQAFGGQALQGLRRRRLHLHVADAELVHRHRGAAAGGGDHADTARPGARGLQRHAPRQREGLEHRIGDADAGDAQVLQEGVGHVVLAGECAGVRGRHLCGSGRSAQLVGQHRLAAACGFEGEGAQAVAVVKGFQEQQIAVDGRIVQRRRADLADAEVGLGSDRHQPGKAHAARLAARHQRTEHAAALRCDEEPAARQALLGEGRVGRQHQAVARVHHAQAVGAEQAHAGAARTLAQRLFARSAVGTGFGKAAGQHREQRHAQPGGLVHHAGHGIGGCQHVHVFGHLRQRGQAGIGRLALHRGPAGVDRVDAAGITRLAQEAQRPAGRLAGIVRGADQRHAARAQQRIGQGTALKHLRVVHSALTCRVWNTLAQCSTSFWTKARNSAGELPTTTAP